MCHCLYYLFDHWSSRMIFWPEGPYVMPEWMDPLTVSRRSTRPDWPQKSLLLSERSISYGDADMTLIIGKPCKGCRIRTCTPGKKEASPDLPQQGKWSKRWQSFGTADSECHEQEWLWTLWLGFVCCFFWALCAAAETMFFRIKSQALKRKNMETDL